MRPADTLFHGFALGAVLIALGALVWLLVSIIISGAPALAWSFLTDPVSTNADRAGFYSALRGSLVLMIITVAVAIPIGFAAAIYLEKFAAISGAQLTSSALAKRRRLREAEAAGLSGPALALRRAGVAGSFGWARVGPTFNRAIEVNISNLAAVPSIIYGLLGLALFVTFIGLNKSLLAGGLTLALLVLPIVIIASREAVRAVPVSIEQGAMALGASKWQAVARQTVPAALPGMLTGTILAMSRAIGESAPLIVVGGIAFGTQLPSVNPLDSNDTPLFAMPLQIFDWADRPQEAFLELAGAGIIVLLGVLILMNAVAIVLRNKFSRRW
jgi:phosphate transport system permease protein